MAIGDRYASQIEGPAEGGRRRTLGQAWRDAEERTQRRLETDGRIHVYLDTVVLLGTISTRYPEQQASFAAGAVTGSFLFFFSLGYGATWFENGVFAKPTRSLAEINRLLLMVAGLND